MKTLIGFLVLFGFTACSVFQSTEKAEDSNSSGEKVEEVYVFDDISDNDTNRPTDEIKKLENELDKTLEKNDTQNTTEVDVFNDDADVTNPNLETVQSGNFYLQLGAFSTLKRAEQFTEENISLVPFQLSIIFNPSTSLYTVRSSPYKTKNEVALLRDDLKEKGIFKDSFIVSE